MTSTASPRAPRRNPRPRPTSAAHVALVGLLGFGLFGAASFVDGSGNETVVEAAPSDEGATTETSAVTSASTASAAAASTPDTTALGVPKQEGVPRVYTAGDSTAGGLGTLLEPFLAEMGVEQRLDYKVSSGLTRDDFYSWPDRLREQVPLLDPEVVVVMFGGNDAQPIELPDGRKVNVDAPEWAQEYGRRVGETMDYLSEGGRSVIWVGVTSAESDSFNDRLVVLRDVLLAQAAARPQITFVDPWPLFNGPDGTFAEYVVDDDGEAKAMRSADDGFHLNPTGAKRLARRVAVEIGEVTGKPAPALPENPWAIDGASGVYKVQPGDAWALIARRLGVSTEVLLETNGVAADEPLYVDDLVKVPTPITGIEVISPVPSTSPPTT